jgi:hypothetical protein
MGCWCSLENCSSGNSKKSGKLRNPFSSFSLFIFYHNRDSADNVEIFLKEISAKLFIKNLFPHRKVIKPYITFSLFLPLSLSFNIGHF